MPGFRVDAGDPDSGPQASTVSALSTEPSPQLQQCLNTCGRLCHRLSWGVRRLGLCFRGSPCDCHRELSLGRGGQKLGGCHSTIALGLREAGGWRKQMEKNGSIFNGKRMGGSSQAWCLPCGRGQETPWMNRRFGVCLCWWRQWDWSWGACRGDSRRCQVMSRIRGKQGMWLRCLGTGGSESQSWSVELQLTLQRETESG